MLKVYNTLTRKKEELKPVHEGQISMYSCGPTVYSYAHIGNLRTYVFMDILVRTLKYNGYKVKSVMNITDVGHLLSDADEGEDKMEKAAKERKVEPLEIAKEVTDVFFKDLEKLNILRPTVTPKATDNIKEMIDIVLALLEKGYAYETSDGIYFDIQKFPGYGKLSGQKLDEMQAGARVEVNNEKHHPADFALWKKAEPNHIMKWESPWGLGYPGWHIECTAMSHKYLGVPFDIHTGGVDHIPIHHENEIAQSEAYFGKKAVNCWMHSEFMMVDGGKMSKSLGNTYTISDLEKRGYSALDFRYFCLNTHYGQKLNFTFTGIESAKIAYNRLKQAVLVLKNSDKLSDEKVLEKYKQEFEDAINDDLNVSLALGTLWTLVKQEKTKNAYELVLNMDKVFGLSLDNIKEETEEIPEDIKELAEKRWNAKKAKDFKTADEARDALKEKGYTVLDSADGYTIKKI